MQYSRARIWILWCWESQHLFTRQGNLEVVEIAMQSTGETAPDDGYRLFHEVAAKVPMSDLAHSFPPRRAGYG